MPAVIEVNYFNSFWLKKIVDGRAASTTNPPTQPFPEINATTLPSRNVFPGVINPTINNTGTGYPYFAQAGNTTVIPGDPGVVSLLDWHVEEARIRGGYNNTNIDYGVRAYIEEEYPQSAIRFNSLIYSGIYNARTGINNTNQFPIGEDIVRSVDPRNGSIQKIYAEDTNLIIFQENKVNRALIDKDAIFSAEGGGTVTSSNVVIGQIVPYAGEYGISDNPESFAVYGFRKYFTDKNKGSVLRLSHDGITEISRYGMTDFFRDQFSTVDTIDDFGQLIGGWDNYTKQYTLNIKPFNQDGSTGYSTLAFDESVLGWPTFYSYNPNFMFSVNGTMYSIPDYNADSDIPNPGGCLYRHYEEGTGVNRNNFYGISYPSSIEFLLNPNPSTQKVFKTIGYEGNNGWQVDSIVSDVTGLDLINSVWQTTQDTTANPPLPAVFSYYEGAYTEDNVQYYAGFYRKENKYVANLINNSPVAQGEVLFGVDMTGIKGYVATVKMSTDATTNPGGTKELFAASSEFVISSI
tara:strand:- start:161 stop:1720 length:1560 start_codon:yes stop_codon:yes gene_type:complete